MGEAKRRKEQPPQIPQREMEEAFMSAFMTVVRRAGGQMTFSRADLDNTCAVHMRREEDGTVTFTVAETPVRPQ